MGPRSPRWLSLVRRWGSATDGDSCKEELVVSFDPCVTRLLCESAFVGRHDARIVTC